MRKAREKEEKIILTQMFLHQKILKLKVREWEPYFICFIVRFVYIVMSSGPIGHIVY